MQFRYYLILILLVFSLLWNLGIYPLYLEEPRRAVVALEMFLTGNYIVPTIMGELYFAKPPLFNWILVVSSKILDGFSEFSVRFPTVVSLIFIGLFHFLITKKTLGKEVAFFSSLLFITSGNILFYFSLLGEIDIFYSLLIYLLLVSIYWFYRKNPVLMFVFPFLFASLGFLTKGFPSIVFLYVSLFVFLFFEKKLNLLLYKWHLVGIFIFSLPVSLYFFLYSTEYPLKEYLIFLWKESSQRTLIENHFKAFFIHLFEFPLKTFLAIFPWSFLFLFISKKGLKELWEIPFLRYSVLIYISNYLVYWISPGANQRYVYMLFPFLLTVLIYLYFREKNPLKEKTLKLLFSLLILTFSVISFSLPFIKQLKTLDYIFPVSIIFGLIFLVLFFRILKKPVYYMVISLLWFRVLFDTVYLPVKAKSGTSFLEKKFGIKVAKITDEKNLFYFGKDRVDYGLLFYIERERGEILKRSLKLKRKDFYLSKVNYIKGFKANIHTVLTFKTKREYVLFYLNR